MALADVLLVYACTFCGLALPCAMYAAPVTDLRRALRAGTLGKLNPTPWVWAMGNCFGWILYGYFHQNLIVAASAMPGLLISLYLNIGAIKLQYHALHKERWERDYSTRFGSCDTLSTVSSDADASSTSTSTCDDVQESSCSVSLHKQKGVSQEATSNNLDSFVPQEKMLFKVTLAWTLVCIYAGWFANNTTASFVIGCIVNLVMLIFYGAPLHTLGKVVKSGDSSIIHRPSMVMSFSNAFFWAVYGMATNDIILYAPNALGCFLGAGQMILCLLYPSPTFIKRDETTTTAATPFLGQEEQRPLFPPAIGSESGSYSTIPAEVPVFVA